MLFKALVKDNETKQYSIIESEYSTKAQFIRDLRLNGYSVNPEKVKKAEIFDYIMEHTDCNKGDWKNN